jgi:putative transposase
MGRKRHAVVDTLGLLWLLVVHPAHIQDRDGARLVLAPLAFCLFRWRVLWADAAYGGALEEWVSALRPRRPGCSSLRLEIVQRIEGVTGWQLLPKRWIVERTFGWLSRSRRLARDYETHLEHSQSMVYIAMTHLMPRRLNNSGTF